MQEQDKVLKRHAYDDETVGGYMTWPEPLILRDETHGQENTLFRLLEELEERVRDYEKRTQRKNTNL